jgi:hypothetical protein
MVQIMLNPPSLESEVLALRLCHQREVGCSGLKLRLLTFPLEHNLTCNTGRLFACEHFGGGRSQVPGTSTAMFQSGVLGR